MKNKFAFLLLGFVLVFNQYVFAHDAHSIETASISWKTTMGKSITGHFFLLKNDTFYIEQDNGKLARIALNQIIPAQRNYIIQRQTAIDHVNQNWSNKSNLQENNMLASSSIQNEEINFANSKGNIKLSQTNSNKLTVLIGIGLLLVIIFGIAKSNGNLSFKNTAMPVILLTAILSMGFRFVSQRKYTSTTRISFMDSAFSYFKPTINTRSDATYYYVESVGLPDHETMIGITGWQQQVPIPQCYIGNNAWSIPLNPVIATQPVPVNNKHFLRGAVAIAVNGIPIFNPYTNTGVDAFLDGQLDQFGGHSGRADDYHYHIAPAILYNTIPTTSPIAFALDGFAIYGAKESDGSNMSTLDTNHGHFGKDGIYHYHTSASAPYMIKNMVGKVTEDTTLQIVPQAVAKGVRPALTPLKGAVITHNIMNPTKDGFTLTYTLSGRLDTVRYNWTSQGAYTYEFFTASGYTKSNYKGQPICTVPVNATQSFTHHPFQVFAKDRVLTIHCASDFMEKIDKVRILDASGKTIYNDNYQGNRIESNSLVSGIYYLRLTGKNGNYTTKFFAY